MLEYYVVRIKSWFVDKDGKPVTRSLRLAPKLFISNAKFLVRVNKGASLLKVKLEADTVLFILRSYSTGMYLKRDGDYTDDRSHAGRYSYAAALAKAAVGGLQVCEYGH